MHALCCRQGIFASLARAAAKAASARLRRLGALRTADAWAGRAQVCERCALRVVHRGISYCGTPFLAQIQRDPAVHGCGCPCGDKARDPAEHCPVDDRYRPAERRDARCNCKWCIESD